MTQAYSRAAKKRRGKVTLAQPKTFTLADLGLSTQAAQHQCVIEDAVEKDADGKTRNPNDRKRARRLSVAQTYHKQGHLSKRQMNAAERLLNAHEARFKTPSNDLGVKVDKTAKPDQNVDIQIDRQSRYVRLSRLLSGNKYRAYVEHVARDDLFLSSMPGYRKDGRYMERLKDGLDAFADLLERS